MSLISEAQCLGLLACGLQRGAQRVHVWAHVHTRQSRLVPHSPPHLSRRQRVDRRGWASGPVAGRCGAIPKPLCFPSPPLYRPSSLFLFLFCCRFNFSSWTLSVLPERYLVFLLPVWHPPLSFFTTPHVSPSRTRQHVVP